jgi:hypothetical protein
MRVYALEGEGHYSGGLAIVAAKSKRTAIKLANESTESKAEPIDYTPDVGLRRSKLLKGVSFSGTEAQVLHIYEWRE